MQETTISQWDDYEPSTWTRFLWWLATAEKELILTCVIDRNRYAIVGMTVLGTWTFATLAWSYFFYTVTANWILAVLLGLFMGGIILTIDRALIKGISKSNKQKLVPLLFRGVLALTIGLFMAQPALLYLFDKEIHVQISLDNEQRKRQKRQQQDTVYQASKSELWGRRNNLQAELNNKYSEVSDARNEFIAETDGTGGSKKVGLKNIAQAKQREYEKLDKEYQQMQLVLQPQVQSTDSTLRVIDANMLKEQQAFETLLNDGFITRIEALNNLVKNNTAVAYRYYLLVAILMLIELMPVIAKTMLPNGSYDEKVRLREEIEKELIQNNYKRELALKEQFNQTAFDQENTFIQNFFAASNPEQHQKMQDELDTWKSTPGMRFSKVWENLKRTVFSKAVE